MTGLTKARQVADAVLYEGYLLYPYRASAPKNQVRWQFGILGPEGADAAGAGEPPAMATEVAMESWAGSHLDIFLRFLQVQLRVVERWDGNGWVAVDELLVDGTRWTPFHEAVPREVPLPAIAVDELFDGREIAVGAPAGEEIEELHEGGRIVGRLVRTRWELRGTVSFLMRRGYDPRLRILGVGVDNETSWSPGGVPGWMARDVAARYSFVGTHLLMTVKPARFLSLVDGPAWMSDDARSIGQYRCWPVLISTDEGYDAVLVSPIILGDHPEIAPGSAGDLFGATEIDEILTLRVMTMTEQEKAEARGTDPRAAAILDRCDAMSDEALAQLHGARRPTPPIDTDDVRVHGAEVPWWDEGENARAEPTTDSVIVNGARVAQGSRVLLRPSRRADAQDLLLAGLNAIVARVYFDVDGGTHLAVTLEDDPASDLYDTTGRFYYFGPEEIVPLP